MKTPAWMDAVTSRPARGLARLVARHGRRNVAIGAGLAVIPVVLLIPLVLGPGGGAGRIPTARVKRGPVTIKITESGELRARDQVTISAVNDKQILWLCTEGAFVEQGDTLVVFESEK